MSNTRVSKIVDSIKLLGLLLVVGGPTLASAQSEQITFHKDIEPILQRS